MCIHIYIYIHTYTQTCVYIYILYIYIYIYIYAANSGLPTQGPSKHRTSAERPSVYEGGLTTGNPAFEWWIKPTIQMRVPAFEWWV